jgi:hypothetical protein
MHLRFTGHLIAIAALVALATTPAMTHHGWAGNTEDIRITGTVERTVSLAGPHATMQVRDEEGRLWDITLAPPARTDRAGLGEGSLPEGDSVTIVGQRNRDAERLEIKTQRVEWNDRTFEVYPERR